MQNIIKIANNGPLIVETNYWETALAKRGFCYLSWNASAARLLVPKTVLGYGAVEEVLKEMRTAKFVTISKQSVNGIPLISIIFDDESYAPFSISVSANQTDRAFNDDEKEKRFNFYVYTEAGMELNLPASIA